MRALVTGGGGFLGRYIVEQLQARGDTVSTFSRGAYPELEATGVTCIRGDLGSPSDVAAACQGMDAVFHVAAMAEFWGPRERFMRINVEGTRHLIAACRSAGVRKLVYTSTPSVVFAQGDLCGVDERQPYPATYAAFYPETKALAEREVLAANGVDGADGLATCSLRPHLIYGPRDRHIVPLLMERARTGKLVRFGKIANQVDVCYVETAAHAHLQACDALAPTSPVGGKAYFISDGEPVVMWDWINELLGRLGLPTRQKRLPLGLALAVAGLLETAWKVLPLRGKPPFTRFMVANFAASHYFSVAAARRDFGFTPLVDREEGLRRTVDYFKDRLDVKAEV